MLRRFYPSIMSISFTFYFTVTVRHSYAAKLFVHRVSEPKGRESYEDRLRNGTTADQERSNASNQPSSCRREKCNLIFGIQFRKLKWDIEVMDWTDRKSTRLNSSH